MFEDVGEFTTCKWLNVSTVGRSDCYPASVNGMSKVTMV